MRPCYFCAADESRLYQCCGCSFSKMPWKLNTWDDYRTSCEDCEIYVTVSSREEYFRIKKIIRQDKRESGNKGPCLTMDINVDGQELKVGDRLEPHPGMPDIFMIWDIKKFPCTLLFWRVSNEVMTRHRNPLFRSCDPYRVITIDVLHGLHLGPMQSIVKNVLHVVLASGIWGGSYDTLEEQYAVSVDRLRSSIFHWYKNQAPNNVTRLVDLTKKMVGSRNHPLLKSKAMETYGLLLYCKHLMEHLSIFSDKLRQSVESMIGVVKIMQEHDLFIPPLNLQVRVFFIGR